jgi:hypothetical protein
VTPQPGSRTRLVQHATLRPASPDDVAALRFSVEDALNTIDFADCGRLVLVRKLRLRGLPPRPTPTQVSRCLEAAWREVAMHAWPAEHPAADQAPAVFFASHAQARIAWLERQAHGEPLDAWFWPQAVPELPAATASAGAAMHVLHVLQVLQAVLEEAAPAFIEQLRRWPDAVLRRWAAELPDAAAPMLLRHLVVPESGLASSTRRAAEQPPLTPAPAGVQPSPQAHSLHARLGPSAVRREARWLLALWMAEDAPARPTRTEVDALWQQLVQPAEFVQQRAPVATPEAAAPHGIAHTPRRSSANPAPTEARIQAPASAHELAAPRDAHTSPAAPTTSVAPPIASAPQAKPPRRQRMPLPLGGQVLPWLVDAQPSTCGGLLWLSHVLARLRIDAWLLQQPSAARGPWVRHWLLNALDLAEAPGHEPQRQWFALDDEARDILNASVFTAAPWSRSFGVPADAQLDAPLATRLWTLQVRRTLRRRARLGLREVVKHRSWMSATPTHIDVVMAVDDADLRLRRVGLDVDPGWLPWLGRIVGFHFVAREQLPPWPTEEPSHG